MYFIEAGRLKLPRETLEGLTIIQHIVFKGEVVADASLFSKDYHCSVVPDTNDCTPKVQHEVYLTR